MRSLGIDYGDKRIGLALSDNMGMVATPWRTLINEGEKKSVEQLLLWIEEEGVQQVVIGHPINMNGTLGPLSEKATRLKGKLEEQLDIPVLLWDERLSSKSALASMQEVGVKQKKRKALVDQIAAQIILQSYLDSL